MKFRKDPKSMSIEELEEILSKNKGKNLSKLEREDTNKSLNTSYYSHKNNTESSKVFNKLNEKLEKIKLDNHVNNSISPLNIFHKNLQNESINYSNNVTSSIQYSKFISPKDSNFSGYMSDQQDNFKHINIINTVVDEDISIKSNSSIAASNALKALQDKIKKYQFENEEMKKKLMHEEDKNQKEREDFQSKFLKEVSKTREIENSYKKDIESLKEENNMLNNIVNEQKIEINLLKTNIQIIENEKDRHLEQNVMDKENLKQKIDIIIKEYESSKNKFNSINKENAKLKERLSQNLEEIKNYEMSNEKLHEEISINKKKSKTQICNYQNQVEEMKQVFEKEKNELNEKIISLKDKYKQQACIIKEYEQKIKELRTDVKTIDKANKGIKMTKVPSSIISSVPKIKKTSDYKVRVGSKSRSKSKEVKITSNINKKVVKNINIKPKKYNKSPNKYKNIPTDKSYDTKKNMTISNNLEDDYLNEIENLKKENNIKESENKVVYDFINKNVNDNNSINKIFEMNENNSLNHINDTIFSLERNIAELNRNYKNLLIKINVGASIEEQQNLKKSANIIANNLHDQSEKLVNLKSKQQELLKYSLNL